MAPMTRFDCDSDGLPSKELAEYYIRRSEHDTALIIIEGCAVNGAEALGYAGGAQFHSKTHSDSWRPIIDAIHANGSKVWLQLYHAGRLTTQDICGSMALAPSPVELGKATSYWRPQVGDEIVNFQTKSPYSIPCEINIVQIEKVVNDFAHATQLAQEAGFDGVEFHGAHGYLLHTFNFRKTNLRTDAYGFDGQFKFVTDIIKECRKRVERSFIFSYRLSVHMVDNPIIRYSELDLNLQELIPKLEEQGIDVFHSSEITADKKLFGHTHSLAQLIREHTKKPLVICGGIQSLKQVESLIGKDADCLIAFGRNFISNYNLIDLLKSKRDSKIVKFEYVQHIDTIY